MLKSIEDIIISRARNSEKLELVIKIALKVDDIKRINIKKERDD